jgi:hypothetical protein
VKEKVFKRPLLIGLVRDFPKDSLHMSAVANESENVREQLWFCQELG